MFAPHLPPSAALPIVLALDPQAEAALASYVEGGSGGGEPGQAVAAPADARDVDALLACRWPEDLAASRDRLRPGGRLIILLSNTTSEIEHGERRLAELHQHGYIHCLIETLPAGGWLCRGERPPLHSGAQRLAGLASSIEAGSARALVVLVKQTPNKPAWRLEPGERRVWEAARLVDPSTGEPALLTFTSLVKAVAFMQPAVLAGLLTGINKTGRYALEQVEAWGLPLVVNPAFEDWRSASLAEPVLIDPAQSLASEEG